MKGKIYLRIDYNINTNMKYEYVIELNTHEYETYGPTIRKSVLGVTKVGTSSSPNM